MSCDANPRILLLGPAVHGGGAEAQFRDLSERLFHGSADVITLLEPKGTNDHLNRRIRSLHWNGEWTYPRMVVSLRRQISRERYDAIVSYGNFPNLLAWSATRAMRSRPRLIFCEITRLQMAAHYGQQSRLVTALQRRAYPTADVIAANSIDGAQECVDFLGCERSRVVRVPNLLDTAALRDRASEPMNLPWPNHKHVVTTNSRLVGLKRIDTLIQSHAELPEELDCALVISGSGAMLPSLQKLASDLGRSRDVYFVGWQDNPYPLVARSTVFVLTSAYEGFSNSVLEAMSLDVPVISSRWGTDVDILSRAGALLAFDLGDTQCLTKALLRLLGSSAERQCLVEAARECRLPHEMGTAMGAYEGLIKAVIHGEDLPGGLLKFEQGLPSC